MSRIEQNLQVNLVKRMNLEPSKSSIISFLAAVRSQWTSMRDIPGMTVEKIVTAALAKTTDCSILFSAKNKTGAVNAIIEYLKGSDVMSLPTTLEKMRGIVNGSNTVGEIKSKIAKNNSAVIEIMESLSKEELMERINEEIRMMPNILDNFQKRIICE